MRRNISSNIVINNKKNLKLVSKYDRKSVLCMLIRAKERVVISNFNVSLMLFEQMKFLAMCELKWNGKRLMGCQIFSDYIERKIHLNINIVCLGNNLKKMISTQQTFTFSTFVISIFFSSQNCCFSFSQI